MIITFLGAAQHVTGSCTLVECGNKKMLVDCGMPQGSDEKEMGDELSFRASSIDCVFLTHAHIDHSGWLPLLVRDGFHGDIWCTSATGDLADIMLADSAHIQESEAEWQNRKLKRRGGVPVEPIYTQKDAEETMHFFKVCEYDEEIALDPHIRFRFTDAGHLLGSASVKLWLEEGGKSREIIFSGDVGNLDQPLIKDPKYLRKADYVVIESTYGDRLHKKPEGAVGQSVPNIVRARQLADIVNRTFDRGGNLIIPAFAVGRTQEMLYLFLLIHQEKLCPKWPQLPVFVDSPLSVKATSVFAGNIEGYFDSEAMALVKKGINPLSFPGLVPVTDVSDSKALNFRTTPCVIISSSGMCEAGRIKHHLKHNLWRPECTILFTGYQAEGTLGRSIRDGARHVSLFGEQVDVNAEIRNMDGISGHADRDGLIKWLEAFEQKPGYVFVNHGEEETALSFAYYISEHLGIKAYAPKRFEHFNLLDEASLPKAVVVKETELPYYRELMEALKELDERHSNFETVYDRLVKVAGNKKLEPKDAIRLLNAVSRLSSDLEFLQMKWNRDADERKNTK